MMCWVEYWTHTGLSIGPIRERPENGDEQLEHPCRLQTSAVQTTERKSLYNQEYGVFTRDTSGLHRLMWRQQARWS